MLAKLIALVGQIRCFHYRLSRCVSSSSWQLGRIRCSGGSIPGVGEAIRLRQRPETHAACENARWIFPSWPNSSPLLAKSSRVTFKALAVRGRSSNSWARPRVLPRCAWSPQSRDRGYRHRPGNGPAWKVRATAEWVEEPAGFPAARTSYRRTRLGAPQSRWGDRIRSSSRW